MSKLKPELPGRLGNPNLTLATDPRLDPILADFFAQDDSMDFAEVSISADSSYEDVLAYVTELEQGLDPFYEALYGSLPPVANVTRRTEVIPGVDDNEILLFIHEPSNRQNAIPAVVHTHGGGMVFLSAADLVYVRWRDELAAMGMCVVGVEFRNGAGKLGNHPFPAGLNDCASALRWAHQQRQALDITNLIVSGESGGGNLSLATAIKANQEGWISEIDGVYSCCPYISGSYHPAPPELTSLYENEDYMLGGEMSQALLKAYDPTGEQASNPLAFPYHATRKDLTGLPPHTISVNELDPLRDEGLVYARNLRAAGVRAVSRTVNGAPHGGDTDYLSLIPDIYYSTIRDIYGFASAL
jgi:acetyl esterase/lipase